MFSVIAIMGVSSLLVNSSKPAKCAKFAYVHQPFFGLRTASLLCNSGNGTQSQIESRPTCTSTSSPVLLVEKLQMRSYRCKSISILTRILLASDLSNSGMVTIHCNETDKHNITQYSLLL